MTQLFSLFQRARSRDRDALACDIAARCAIAVRRRLRFNAAEMGVPELRGYIRARAFSAVREYGEQAVAEGRWPAANEDQLIAAILERTVYLVVRDLQSPPIITIPSPHVPLRGAA